MMLGWLKKKSTRPADADTVPPPRQAAEAGMPVSPIDAARIEALRLQAGELLSRQAFAAAISLYSQIASAAPDDVRAQLELANALKDAGQLAQAIGCYDTVIRLDPGCAEAWFNQASGLFDLGRFKQAIEKYTHFVKLMPGYVDGYLNLGSALQNDGQLDAALVQYAQALQMQPDYAEVHSNIGFVLQAQGRFHAALESCERAVALRPALLNAHVNHGLTLVGLGRLQEAADRYRHALSLRPGFALAHSNLLYVQSFDATCSPASYVAEARRYGEAVASQVTPYRSWQRTGRTGGLARPLRVGLVSGDLRLHPVGFFLEAILGQIDQTTVSMIAYTTLQLEDPLTARLKTHCAEWHSLAGLDDAAAAAKIHGDGIDILIDLAGHTAHNRLPLFAWKPAPVQVSWLGYWASTGVPGMDYVLTDPVSAPPECQAQFTETLWYLPQTRLCFTPPADAPNVSPLPALQHDDRHVTFGSFQNGSKISDATLALWARVLAALPTARLRLQNKQLSQDSGRVAMQERLATAGIAPDRVELAGAVPMAQYLAAHAQVDILLDTFPFPGGTTTCEALWMGVPTLTLPGLTMLSRQGASLMSCAGLANWIAQDEADYVARAQHLGSDLPTLAALRAGLREQVRVSPLFDAQRFAKDLQVALEGMMKAGPIHPPAAGDGDV